jgi:hypothetical protein
MDIDRAPQGGDEPWLSDDDARRLIARAAELDALQRSSVSVEELRTVAQEAGISAEAFGRALKELKSGALRSPSVGQAVAARLAQFRRPAAVASLAGAALVTPGDVIPLTMAAALVGYGIFEGVIRVLGWAGAPPAPPAAPSPGRLASDRRDSSPSSQFLLRILLRPGDAAERPVGSVA